MKPSHATVSQGSPHGQAQVQPPADDPRAELLAQMHDLAEPAWNAYWPLAAGEWLLLVAALALLLWGLWRLRARLQTNRYRRRALAEYQQILQQKSGQSEQWLCQELTRLLKRTFFAAYPAARAHTAGLYGRDWLALLDLSCKTPLHAQQYEATLNHLLYMPAAKSDAAAHTPLLDDYTRFAEAWIKQHQRLNPALWQQIQDQLARLGKQSGGLRHVSL